MARVLELGELLTTPELFGEDEKEINSLAEKLTMSGFGGYNKQIFLENINFVRKVHSKHKSEFERGMNALYGIGYDGKIVAYKLYEPAQETQ